MTKLQRTFIQNLRAERDRAGLTQEQAAEKTGVSHNYYGAIELGYKFPSVQTIERLASALNIAAFRLFIEKDQFQGIPGRELIELYNRSLQDKLKVWQDKVKADLGSAKAEFLGKLKDAKR